MNTTVPFIPDCAAVAVTHMSSSVERGCADALPINHLDTQPKRAPRLGERVNLIGRLANAVVVRAAQNDDAP